MIEHTLLRKLVRAGYLRNRLGCGKRQLDHALERALHLYPDIKVTKLFDTYRYSTTLTSAPRTWLPPWR